MAAASNESFGLKIATTLSIALTVILLIAVYLLNSNYNLEVEKNAANQKKIGDLTKVQGDLTTQYNDLKTILGYSQIEEYDAAKTAIKKDQEALKAEVQELQKEISDTVTKFQKSIENKGADAAQFEALKQKAREIADGYVTNSDQSFLASLRRLKDLTANQARLSTNMALDYIDLRRDLEQANQTNSVAKKKIEEAYAAAKEELDATIKKDEELRQDLVRQNAEKAETIATNASTATNTQNKLTGDIEKLEKTRRELNAQVSDFQDRASRKEDVMTKPGGRVTFVDYGSSTVRVNVNRAQGVRPLMRFTIFDKNVAGVTSAKPKAAVELIKVGDPQRGENDSLARILKTFDPADPIKYNDYIYSVGWSYDHPQRFALVGKLDINRDGRDDRGDLIRMIEAAGGVIEFDLPPPGVDRKPGLDAVARGYARLGEPVPASVGRAAGKISGLAMAYVVDTRASLNVNAKKGPDASKEDTAFLQEESTATKEARENGVRPLPIEKLLNMLGYDYSAPIEGRREAFDRAAVKSLLKPKPNTGAPATGDSGTATPPKDDAEPKSDMPK